MGARYELVVLAVAVVAGPGAMFLHAQGAGDAELPEPVSLRGDAGATDVYINDSFEASDAIAKARRLARAGRWAHAAELLQRTADAAERKLVRLSSRYYVDIRDYTGNLIAEWPRAGISAYRTLFESEMNTALADMPPGKSVSGYLALFDRFFCTAAAAELADTIGQSALEAGDLALAERVYRRVLDHHPDKAAFTQRYRAMLALVRAMRGKDPLPITESEASVKIRWMGEDRTLGGLLPDLDASFAALRRESSPVGWPIFGGNAERNRPASCEVDELGLRWRFERFGRQRPGFEGEEADESFLAGRERARHLTIHPVVSGDLVYIQHYREVVALHRNTGMVAWRFWADAASSSSFNDFEDQPPGWDSVTVYDGRVYATLPGDVVPNYGYESAQTPPELICLDADSGRVIWPRDREAFMNQFVEVRFDSTPIVRHGRLYVVGRRRRSFGFEDCYLYRFNAANGRLEFRTHVGSASTGTFGSQRATMAIAAMHGDTVYVCSNLGTIAAVSAHTGAVRWLRLYERDSADQRRESSWITQILDPWAFNPIIWADGRIVCLPTDSPKVFVLADDDGRELHSILLDELGHIKTLLGVHGEVICGVGKEVACYDLSAGATRWKSPLPVGVEVRGRGAWVDQRLLIPTGGGLSSFRVSDGQRADLAWDTGGKSGNLVALPDQLLVAGAMRISAYVRKADIWRGLRERMAAAPSDPLPALELAEVALQGGEWAEAIDVLDVAVRRAGTFMEPIDPALRRRFFDDLLMFVEVLSSRSVLERDVLHRLCTYASQCPPDAAAHVAYRFRFGRLFEQFDEPDWALRLYQQILRDRSLREQPATPSANDSEKAGVRARLRIADLVDRLGVDIYAPYEAEAREWLEGARAADDAVVLERVVETFPNSEAAPLGLIALGELVFQQGRPAEGALRFAQVYHRYPKQVDRPSLMRKIADAYEQAGQIEHAYRWLTKAAREHPSVLVEHGGRRISFAEYRERLASVRERVEPSRPSIKLPLGEHFVRQFDGGAALLVPRFGSQPGSDWSRYFVYTPTGIRAFLTRTNDEAWRKPAVVRSAAELLLATPAVAVFATKYEVFGLDPSTGDRRWYHGEYPADFDLAAADWENGTGFRTHAIEGDRLVSVREDGRMTCVAIDDGQLVWSEPQRPLPAGRVRIAAPWVVYHIIQDGASLIRLIHVATGVAVNTIKINEPRPVDDFFITLDAQLIVTTSRSILAYDVETAAKRWQVTLNGHVRPATVVLDLDALYFSEDGRALRKISLDGGESLWRSEELVRRGEEGLTVHRQDSSVIVSTSASIAAVDAVTGLTLWRGTTPELPRLVNRFVTRSYVMVVDVRNELQDAPSTAYFYDHRNASGLIPRNGGACPLGPLDDVRAIMAADGALIIQTASTIQGWME